MKQQNKNSSAPENAALDAQPATNQSSDGFLKKIKIKLSSFSLTKSWQYLVYIYIVLPGLIFLLAQIFKNISLGSTMSSLFHTYNLYAISTVPNFSPFNFTGIIGIVIAVYFIFHAVKSKDWKDLIISSVLVAANFLYFLFEVNYMLVPYLNF